MSINFPFFQHDKLTPTYSKPTRIFFFNSHCKGSNEVSTDLLLFLKQCTRLVIKRGLCVLHDAEGQNAELNCHAPPDVRPDFMVLNVVP